MKKLLFAILMLGLIGCASDAAVHLVCVRESQVLLQTRGSVYSDETVKPAVDRRYDACMAYHGVQPQR